MKKKELERKIDCLDNILQFLIKNVKYNNLQSGLPEFKNPPPPPPKFPKNRVEKGEKINKENESYWQSVKEMREAQDKLMAEALRLNEVNESNPFRYFIAWVKTKSKLEVNKLNKDWVEGAIYFSTTEIAEQAIENLGEETIITALGVNLRYE